MPHSGLHLGKSSLHRATLAIALAVGAVSLTGCERMQTASRQADAKVEADWQKAKEDRIELSASDQASLKTAEAVIANAKASPDERKNAAATIANILNARRSAAEHEVQQAVTDAKQSGVTQVVAAQAYEKLAADQFDDAARQMAKLRQSEREISQKIWGLQEVAANLKSIAANIADANQSEPKAGRAAIDTKKQEIQGEIQQIDQQLSQKVSEVNKRQDEMKAKTAQQADLNTKSDQLMDQSNQAGGEQSVKLYNQGLDLRKQASHLASELDVAKAQLVPLQQEVDALQSQKKIKQNGIAALDEQAKVLEDGWLKLNGLIGTQKQDAQKLLQDEANQKAKELKALVDAADKQRAAVLATLTSSADNYGKAATAAEKAYQDVSALASDEHYGKADKEAFAALQKAISGGQMHLQQAQVQQAMALVRSNNAAELKDRIAMQQSFADPAIAKEIGGTVPASLAENLSSQLSDVQSKAEAIAVDADKNFEKAASGNATQAEQMTARMLQMFEQYARYSANGDSSLKDQAVKTKATFARLAGTKADAMLPPLPVDLGGGQTKAVEIATGESDAEAAKKRLLAFAAALPTNVDGARGMTQNLPADQDALLPDLSQNAKARADLKAAVARKFTDQPPAAIAAAVPDLTDEINADTAKVEQDSVKFEDASGDPPIVLKKINGEWRITDLGISAAGGKDPKTLLEASTKVYTDIAEEVVADRFPKLDDLKTGLATRLQQAVQPQQ